MNETTTTARKSAVTTLVLTGFVGLMTARHAGQETSKTEFTFETAFGMRTLKKKNNPRRLI